MNTNSIKTNSIAYFNRYSRDDIMLSLHYCTALLFEFLVIRRFAGKFQTNPSSNKEKIQISDAGA